MKTKTCFILMMTLLVAALAYGVIVYPALPETVPVHWNIHGKPDQWGHKAIDVFLAPGIMAAMILLWLALPVLSPKQYKIDPFRETYNEVMILVVGLFAFIHFVLVQSAMHPYSDHSRILVAGIMLFLATLGNFMGKVRRNFWMGIRTPWTLASEPVWIATHRMAGRLMMAAGVAGAFAALLGVSMVWIIALMAGAMLYPAVNSFFLYRRMEGSGTV